MEELPAKQILLDSPFYINNATVKSLAFLYKLLSMVAVIVYLKLF
jgi:hypothetical protein